jgi:hypothetical protein
VRSNAAGDIKTFAVPLKESVGEYALETGHSNSTFARFSPDGRYISYQSDTTGRDEVYVRSIGPEGQLGPATMISAEGGTLADWTTTDPGEPFELRYTSGGKVVAVSITTEPALTTSDPRDLLDLEVHRAAGHGRLPDGRFVIVQRSVEEDEPRQINVVLGIFEDLKQRVPTESD